MTSALDTLNSASRETALALLEPLVERSPWVVELTVDQRPFADDAALAAALADTILAAGTERQRVLFAAHPELAGQEAAEGRMTDASTGEQARLGLLSLSADDAVRLRALNAAYRARFSHPFIIALHRVPDLETLLATFERRLAAPAPEEHAATLDEIASVIRSRAARAFGPGAKPPRTSLAATLEHPAMKAILPLVASTALVLSTAMADAKDTIRIAGNFATEHSSSLAIAKFEEELERLSGGEIDVNVFPAQQLGGAAENVQAVKIGAIEMMWVGTAYLTRTVPELEVIGLPFQFPSREAAFAITDGPVGTALDDMMAKEGMTSLGYMELGFRHLTNNVRPVVALGDIEGLKIRLQPNETHLATFRALGANPVAMDVKELYSALEQGVIDGQENPFAIINVAGYTEVQKHVSNTGHFFDFISVVGNKKWFDGLAPEKQAMVREAMATAVAYQRELAAEQDAAGLAQLTAKGMTFTEVSPELAAALREKTAGVATETKARLDPELVKLLDAETAKLGM